MDQRFQRYVPRTPPLDGLVRCLWYSEGPDVPDKRERLLPTGECTLVFSLEEDPIRIYDASDTNRVSCYRGAVLCGARSDCFGIDVTRRERVMGVQFHPGGVSPFLRVPVSDVSGGCFSPDDVWAHVSSVREELLDTPDHRARFAVLERALSEQLILGRAIHPAVRHAVRRLQGKGWQPQISELAGQANLSPRRFIELFQRQVGITPKSFARLTRFQQVVTMVDGQRDVDWAGVALDCGYYDQAHFIHDFRTFSGYTPSVYLARATSHLNHIALD